MKQAMRWAGLLMLALAGACLGQLAALLVASDSCLDAGGSFNYLSNLCDLKNPQPPMDLSGDWRLWLGIPSLLTGVLMLWRACKN